MTKKNFMNLYNLPTKNKVYKNYWHFIEEGVNIIGYSRHDVSTGVPVYSFLKKNHAIQK